MSADLGFGFVPPFLGEKVAGKTTMMVDLVAFLAAEPGPEEEAQ